MAEPPVLIAGPTASGKSALAVALAGRLGGAVVNADSQQVWRDWRVLTARPSAGEEARVPHHLYGHRDGRAAYSTGDWLREMAPLLDRLAGEGRRAIVVGGTGLYFTALTEGLVAIPPVPAEVRQGVEAIGAGGREALAAALTAEDPATAARLDLANPARTARALEVVRATGRGLSAWQDDPAPPLVSDAVRLALMPDPDWLDARIARRLEAMAAGGALDEAEAARALPRGAPALKALGAAEFIAHVEGRLALDEALARAVLATRRYAKRQRTWIRGRLAGWARLEAEDLDTAVGMAMTTIAGTTPETSR
ncbi:MAG: tRNA (adenosine(37)-N6)-dimethylallyltransferase MiaA [Pseudomonadota bacterium]